MNRIAVMGSSAPARADHRALQSGDRIGRRNAARAELGAVHVAVAGVAAGAAGHRVDAGVVARVAHVVDQRPGAVERRRTEIILVPGHHIAGRMADAAADAFDAGVGGLPLRRSPAAPRGNRPAALARHRSGPWRRAICRRTPPCRRRGP